MSDAESSPRLLDYLAQIIVNALLPLHIDQ